jgi:hypothetical protein
MGTKSRRRRSGNDNVQEAINKTQEEVSAENDGYYCPAINCSQPSSADEIASQCSNCDLKFHTQTCSHKVGNKRICENCLRM